MTSFLQSPCQQYSEVTLSPKSLLPNLGVPREARVIQLHKTHVPPSPIPDTVHIHPALERPQNPGETCSYFLGGNFDLQEFCLSGQHLPRGVDPDEDGALAFALEGTKKKKQQRLGGHSLHSELSNSSK